MSMTIRLARREDDDAIWRILEPVIRAGETYALPRDKTRADALAYWTGPDRETFVAEDEGCIAGTYYLRANQQGGGAHVANCGYVTAEDATGKGVARRMCEHSLDHARTRGFRAMQFNLVIESNERAVRLWQSLGFEIVGRLPGAFEHPRLGAVDALVMFRALSRPLASCGIDSGSEQTTSQQHDPGLCTGDGALGRDARLRTARGSWPEGACQQPTTGGTGGTSRLHLLRHPDEGRGRHVR